jgi:tripartite-type tricarboxylate transporter receptor subunit TctC
MTCRFLFAGAFAFALGSALAQDYPARPIRIVVPYPAGGSADLMPRAVTEKLQAKWGQPVLVENRPGAGGNVGAESVYRAEPDGYTLLASPPGPLVVNQNLYRDLAFDPSKFVPVSVLAEIPNVLLVNPKIPAYRVKDLIDYAKANPGKLNYGSQAAARPRTSPPSCSSRRPGRGSRTFPTRDRPPRWPRCSPGRSISCSTTSA